MGKVYGISGYGFIGSHVVDELLSRGYKVIVFDHHDKRKDLPNSVEFFLGDMRDATAMTEFASKLDGFIHLAGILGTAETVLNPKPAIESNMTGGLNFLEAVSQYNIPGVYIAVGNWNMNNPYSISKNMVERLVHMYNADRKARVNIVRAVNCYGPRQVAFTPFANSKVRKITPSLICRALCGMPMELYGGGVQVSDMVYILDVAKALVNALESADRGEIFPEAVEVGPAEHKTIHEVALLVQKIVKELKYPKPEITSLPMRPGERVGQSVTADIRTLSYVGMSPETLIPLEVGMRETIEWFIANMGVTWTKPS